MCRLSLPPGSSDQRRLLHQVATHYGLASQSFGSEARRHIDLFKACPLVQGFWGPQTGNRVQPPLSRTLACAVQVWQRCAALTAGAL